MTLAVAPAVAASADPGSPSPHGSCVAAITDYVAHNDPTTGAAAHGLVGRTLSADATSGPGVVGQFNSGLAGVHGSIANCVPQ